MEESEGGLCGRSSDAAGRGKERKKGVGGRENVCVRVCVCMCVCVCVCVCLCIL